MLQKPSVKKAENMVEDGKFCHPHRSIGKIHHQHRSVRLIYVDDGIFSHPRVWGQRHAWLFNSVENV
jgi:hypothetical protein